jgi:hypothetical protein
VTGEAHGVFPGGGGGGLLREPGAFTSIDLTPAAPNTLKPFVPLVGRST